MLVLRKECPATFLLPCFSRGGEGSPPFGAPAVQGALGMSPLWHSSGALLAVSQPCDDISQWAGKGALLCGGDLSVHGGGQSQQ